MTPLEAAIRAACEKMGANPDSWRGFEEIGRAAAEAFMDAMPAEVRLIVRRAYDGQWDF